MSAASHPSGLPTGSTDHRCGGCAWFGAGQCVFAARGDAPGPSVTASTPACAFWEQPVTCGPCGACCREAFDSVPVTDGDLARLGDAAGELVREEPDGWRELARVPSPLGRGSRCALLRGDGSAPRPYRCARYASRPTNCRELAPGSGACLTARRRVGLSPRRPGQSADGPLASPAPTCRTALQAADPSHHTG